MKAEESTQKVEQVPLSGSLSSDGGIDFANTKKKERKKERVKEGKKGRILHVITKATSRTAPIKPRGCARNGK